MKKILAITILLVYQTLFAQINVNNYKYIIVPAQYEFQKSQNQYQINALTKFLFEKYGFTTYMSTDEFPADMAKNPCLALKGNIVNIKSLLTTKVKVQLIDCNNKVIFSSKEAKTKEKDYKKAYHEAIREAFFDIKELNYKYVNNLNATKNVVNETNLNKPKDTIAISKVTKTTTIVSDKAKTKTLPATITGFYKFEKWGRSEIVKTGEHLVAKGGTEAFTFAQIYPTSIPNLFIIKWVAFKAPKLLKLNTDGNLEVDTDNGVKTYFRDN